LPAGTGNPGILLLSGMQNKKEISFFVGIEKSEEFSL